MLDAVEKTLIGGSDIAAIAGLSKFKSALDVWRRIVEGYEQPDAKPLKRGRLMEPVIREMAQDEYGWSIIPPEKFPRKLRNPKHPWLRCSLDDVIDVAGAPVVVDYKSVDLGGFENYGDGDDEFPEEYHCQLQLYAGEAKTPSALLVPMLGLSLRKYHIHADEDAHAAMLEIGERFWKDHILTKRPPEVDDRDSTTEWLRTRYARNNGLLLQPTPEVTAMIVRYVQLRNERTRLKRECTHIQNQLIQFIGEADGFKTPEVTFTYKKTKPKKVKTDVKALVADPSLPPDLLMKYTRLPEGFKKVYCKVKGLEIEPEESTEEEAV